MRDPYFSAILMQIEELIHNSDRETRSAGIWSPKDSAVKSALRKAELAIGGKKPVAKPKDQVEEWVLSLSGGLVELGRELAREAELSIADFVIALKATQDSLDIRREVAGHARGYLEFLEEFMKEARGEKGE